MKRLAIVVVVLIIVAFLAYRYVFHSPHRDITQEEVKHEIEAADLLSEYGNSVDQANAKYLDHVILVGGEVTAVDSTSITLAPGIYCHMHEEEIIDGIKIGDRADIKGRVVGYDDLFGELRMDFCHFVKLVD